MLNLTWYRFKVVQKLGANLSGWPFYRNLGEVNDILERQLYLIR